MENLKTELKHKIIEVLNLEDVSVEEIKDDILKGSSEGLVDSQYTAAFLNIISGR